MPPPFLLTMLASLLLTAADKPFALLEFSFVCEQAGLHFYNANTTCLTHEGRGWCYRHYTETIACQPYCLGFAYFILYDQPVNRRNPGGESHNFGLVSQQDRPYDAMLPQVIAANSHLFDLHDGKGQPFVLTNPDDLLKQPSLLRKLQRLALPNTVSPLVSVDSGDRNGWFDGCLMRLKINEAHSPKTGIHYVGTFDLKALHASRISVGFFCWSKNNGSEWPLLELSEDGVTFTRVPHRMLLLKPGEHFSRYRLENAHPLGNARYARLGIDVQSAPHSWAAMPCEFLFQ